MKRFDYNIGLRLFVIALTFLVAFAGFSSSNIQQTHAKATNSNFGSSQTFSINDVRVAEGNFGMRIATFTITMHSNGAPTFAFVTYTTANHTAIGSGFGGSGIGIGIDYISRTGSVSFGGDIAVETTPDGGTTQTRTVQIQIVGELDKEPNETFFVNLSNPSNASIADGQGVGIIVDEDRAYVADFDRDLKTDFSVFRPSDGFWYIFQSTNGVFRYDHFGSNGDLIVPGDYDADGVTDLVIYRPLTGVWTGQQSSDSLVRQVQWGAPNDKPVQADYDGDDKTDVAVFRDGTWFIMPSQAGNTPFAVDFGAAGDKAVPGDYNGDGHADYAVFRNGVWFVKPSSDLPAYSSQWGLTTDIPVAGDFDGDGSQDIAVFRPSNGVWYILSSLNGQVIVQQWGAQEDIPVVGDYDADGISDIAVFRPSVGVWYVLQSSNPPTLLPPTPVSKQWGQSGDKPVPAAYVPEQ